jgi:hypothetical protein
MTELLSDPLSEHIVTAAAALGFESNVVRSLLADLALQERVREHSVARDVYLTTVQGWWDLLGQRLEAECM